MAVIREQDLGKGRAAFEQWQDAAHNIFSEQLPADDDAAFDFRLNFSPRLPRQLWAMAVRYSLYLLEKKAPGEGVEVRVAPWAIWPGMFCFGVGTLLHYSTAPKTFPWMLAALLTHTKAVYVESAARNTGLSSSGRLIGVVCGASLTSAGVSSASRAMRRITSMKVSRVALVSVSVGSIISASSTMSGK